MRGRGGAGRGGAGRGEAASGAPCGVQAVSEYALGESSSLRTLTLSLGWSSPTHTQQCIVTAVPSGGGSGGGGLNRPLRPAHGSSVRPTTSRNQQTTSSSAKHEEPNLIAI